MSATPSVGPGVLIAATHSGAGKTTVTSLLLRALRDRGLKVQPFKVGPDFIDSAYHAEAAGRPAINLDIWMMGTDGVRSSYARWSGEADISVIEAMGGLYDGADGTEHGSAAHIAKLLGVPVIVVLDVYGMTRTAAAILDGLQGFDPAVEIAGCVLNRAGSPGHAAMILEALPDRLRRLVIGTIERRPELEIAERHLGLVTVEENPTAGAEREAAGRRAAAGLDVEQLLHVAGRGAPALQPSTPPRSSATSPIARIAVARDRAFPFYYEENLLLLEDAGFELVPFAPTKDAQLPDAVDAVYIGGGYPESFATELEANRSLAEQLRERVAEGMPLHAECGGLMYLARSLTAFDGKRHAMSGVLPLDIMMDPSYLAIRYVEVCTRAASPLGAPGTRARGQEFHQSRIVDADVAPTLYDVTTSTGQRSREGYFHNAVTASYVHLHFASNPALVTNLLGSAVAARDGFERLVKPPPLV